MKDGIEVRCVFCKKTKVLSFDEAASIRDVPFCECGGPMVAEAATVTNKPKWRAK